MEKKINKQRIVKIPNQSTYLVSQAYNIPAKTDPVTGIKTNAKTGNCSFKKGQGCIFSYDEKMDEIVDYFVNVKGYKLTEVMPQVDLEKAIEEKKVKREAEEKITKEIEAKLRKELEVKIRKELEDKIKSETKVTSDIKKDVKVEVKKESETKVNPLGVKV